MPDRCPGVLDVKALGWTGQRSWLFDSRKETELFGAGGFDSNANVLHRANLLLSGRDIALRWASGTIAAEDPYDRPNPDTLPAARRQLWKGVLSGDGKRPHEWWLLPDEPETALDAGTLMTGLCALLRMAGIGSLRVFCASHSPLFAAGLADHPSVQVIDFGLPSRYRGPYKTWLSMQKRGLEVAAKPDAVARIGDEMVAMFKKRAKEERQEVLREMRAITFKLTPLANDALVQAVTSPGRYQPGFSEEANGTPSRLRGSQP